MLDYRFRFVRSLYLFLALTASSRQVDIEISGEISARCPNIGPGVCCQAPHLDGSSFVVFHGLIAMDIAAIWQHAVWRGGILDINELPADPSGACSGTVLDSRTGPGTWSWDRSESFDNDFENADGASYISLPKSLPPDPTAISGLVMQGILGFVWGGGKWFASPAADRLLGGRGSWKLQRDLRSAAKGNVYARPPRKVIYPTFITINGTEYSSDEAAGNFMYTHHDTGTKLNLTDRFIRRP
ncbi:MAG: hypothetical protein Q9225_002488 [Loekoesia sp. 1 TL-2023]